jgi:hypothetical protein
MIEVGVVGEPQIEEACAMEEKKRGVNILLRHFASLLGLTPGLTNEVLDRYAV